MSPPIDTDTELASTIELMIISSLDIIKTDVSVATGCFSENQSSGLH